MDLKDLVEKSRNKLKIIENLIAMSRFDSPGIIMYMDIYRDLAEYRFLEILEKHGLLKHERFRSEKGGAYHLFILSEDGRREIRTWNSGYSKIINKGNENEI